MMFHAVLVKILCAKTERTVHEPSGSRQYALFILQVIFSAQSGELHIYSASLINFSLYSHLCILSLTPLFCLLF